MIKRGIRIAGLALLALLVYLAAGAALPFIRQPEVSRETAERFEETEFYGDEAGNERAALLTENGEALAERIRLIEGAQERIILSTFEFRSDESGKDVLAALLTAADRGVSVRVIMDGFPAFKDLQLPDDPYFQALSAHENAQIAIYNPVNPLKPWKPRGRVHDNELHAEDAAYSLGRQNQYDFFLGG